MSVLRTSSVRSELILKTRVTKTFFSRPSVVGSRKAEAEAQGDEFIIYWLFGSQYGGATGRDRGALRDELVMPQESTS